MTPKFNDLLARIPQIGFEHHAATLLENTRRNGQAIRNEHSIRDCKPSYGPCIIASAGPSLYRQRILARLAEARFTGTLVATDGAYIQCLKAGLQPDWVVTIDPHPTRIVRWFGDPDLESNQANDDYFARQDLDVSFRKDAIQQNKRNILLVDGNETSLVVATSAPENVVSRTARFARYWFAPLVDEPTTEGLTSQMVELTSCPALNTGGTVGTSAWVFTHQVLRADRIAVVGMDFGYPMDTPLENTQEWNLLKDDPDIASLYPRQVGYWGECYTSPTYFFYLQAFKELLQASGSRISNCTEGGILCGDGIDCMPIEQWLIKNSG